eukprot:Tbor_TRINITY_DN6021_c3_g2::TRINITY_DN6021_c3_g2_i1::g.11143::m.11143/K02941/RP-LP0, RPLP0; large subunit ribosomal protein LP0
MSKRVIVVSQEKQQYEEKMNSLFEQYSKVLFVTVDNIRSQQIHLIRNELRGKAILIMGKKTLQRKIFMNRTTREGATESDQQFFDKCKDLELLRHNTGMIFTNADHSEVEAVLEKNKIQAPARVGTISPCDVVIHAGNTGMDPTKTSFFQALGIATKITKGTVDIINDKKVLSTGDKVDNSTAVLLQKLKISPFYYQMEVRAMWDRGVLFEAADMKINDEAINKMLMSGIKNLTALSIGAGLPTAASFPVTVADCFKKLLAASVATEYSFDEFGAAETIKAAREGKLAAAPAAAAAAPAAPAASKAAPAAAKAPEPSDDEDDDMGSLF